MTIQVKHLGCGVQFGLIERIPRQHKGWQSVTYKGKRYQVFGGIRNYEFIDLSNPLKTRKEAI